MSGTRQGVNDAPMSNVVVMKGLKLGCLTMVLPADNFQITKDMPPILNFDPDGAKDVLLPAISEETKNLVFFIRNWAGGAEDITVKTSADAALTASVVISQNEMAMLTNDGVAWFGAMVGANT
jgi:hypothetical protein